MKTPVTIAVTGAAGQISYSLLFRIAAGNLLGPDQPIILNLLEVTPAMTALQGVVMELDDCAFPLLDKVITTDQPEVAFANADYVFLVGAKPRKAGMERKDLLTCNAEIFSVHGQALNAVASRDVKILVTGNPANTNALIAFHNAPDLSPENFSSMMTLDHNRAIAQLAEQCGVHAKYVKDMIIWGNHSTTQYPDIHHAKIRGQSAMSLVDFDWYLEHFIPTVQSRGAAIIKARGLSSAASAANAAIDHMRTWVFGTEPGNWISMGIIANGDYGVGTDLVYSYPVRVVEGAIEVVRGLKIDDFSMERMKLSEDELKQERDEIRHLLN